MDDPFGLIVWLGAFAILAVVAIVALRAVGPADWSIFRARRDASWPRGVQEEEPVPWRFDGAANARTPGPEPGAGAGGTDGATEPGPDDGPAPTAPATPS